MSIEFAEIIMHPGMMLAMILGLDLLFGDPVYRLHPVRLIGKFLTWYERRLRQIGPVSYTHLTLPTICSV